MEDEIFRDMSEANQEIKGWWIEKKNKIERILSKLDRIIADVEFDREDLIVGWINTYVDFLIELSDIPVYDYIPLLCKTYFKTSRNCKSCPFGVAKGICPAEGSLMDIAAEQVEQLKTTLKLMKLRRLPDEVFF